MFKAAVMNPENIPRAIISDPDEIPADTDQQPVERSLMRSTFSCPGTDTTTG